MNSPPTAEPDRLTVIDVGARGGIDRRWAPFADRIRAYGFEPDPEECERLSSAEHITYLPHALGAHDGEVATLHVTRQPGCSSLLRPNMSLLRHFPYGPMLEVTRTLPVVLARLDTVCRERHIQPDAIKIDAQGAELAILHGCGELLDSTIAVEVEVEFAQMYEGQPLFGDVDAFMRSRGFVLRGLRRTHWRRSQPSGWHAHPYGGQLIHADALYVHHVHSRKALTAYAAYRQFDLVVSLLAHPKGDLAAMSEEARHALADALVPRRPPLLQLVSKGMSSFKNRELRRLVDRLRSATATDWHDPDFF